MDQVTKVVREHTRLVVAVLAVAVLLIAYMLYNGAKIGGYGLKTEGIGAGGAQVNDNPLLPAGHEGYHVRKLEGLVADGVGNDTLRAALAVEDARKLRKQLECTGRERDSGLVKDVKSAEAGWASGREGMTTTDERLRAAMTGQ